MPTARSLTLSIALLLLVVGAANAGEREGRIACTRDVLQLCRSDIPDRGAITKCMAAKHDQLSHACAVVFDAGMRERQAGAR